MDRPYIHFDLHLEIASISADVSLLPVSEWWSGLTERNARSRALDDGAERHDVLSVRVSCPSCTAQIPHLTLIGEGDSFVRACRKCGHRFSVGG